MRAIGKSDETIPFAIFSSPLTSCFPLESDFFWGARWRHDTEGNQAWDRRAEL